MLKTKWKKNWNELVEESVINTIGNMSSNHMAPVPPWGRKEIVDDVSLDAGQISAAVADYVGDELIPTILRIVGEYMHQVCPYCSEGPCQCHERCPVCPYCLEGPCQCNERCPDCVNNPCDCTNECRDCGEDQCRCHLLCPYCRDAPPCSCSDRYRERSRSSKESDLDEHHWNGVGSDSDSDYYRWKGVGSDNDSDYRY